MNNSTMGLTNETFPAFRASVKTGLEHFTGSEIKKENKLNETCAIILGKENMDQLSTALSENENRNKPFHLITNPLILVNDARCPLCASNEVNLEVRDSNGKQYANCNCGASWIEDSEHNKGDEIPPVHGLNLLAYPQSMSTSDRQAWHKEHITDKVIYTGVLGKNNLPIQPGGINSPHFHAIVAGYAKDLDGWLPAGENKEDDELLLKNQTRIAYWHTNRPASPFLAENLSLQEHYEIVLYKNKSSSRHSMSLYRIFKLGNTYQISVDAKIEFNIHTNVPALNTLIVKDIIAMVIKSGLSTPFISGVKPSKESTIQMFEEEIKNYVHLINAPHHLIEALIYMKPEMIDFHEMLLRTVFSRSDKVKIDIKKI